MSLNERLIGVGAAACSTDSVQAFGADAAFSSNIALYQLDGNANDTTGNYNGTATNVTYGTGQFGQAGVFNGSSSAINTTYTPTVANLRTVSLWFKTNATAFGIMQSVGAYGVSSNYSWEWIYMLADGKIGAGYGANNGGAVYLKTTTASYNDNSWHYLTLILNGVYGAGSFVQLYIDGQEVSVTIDTAYSGSISTITGTFRLGHNINVGVPANIFNGSIDQVRIFDKAISAEDVATLYAETTSTASNTNPLSDGSGVALYTMDYDASDAGGLYDGTPTNVEFGVEGQINYGARFNGSSSIIKDVLGSGFTYASKTMTFSAWIFVTDNTNDNVIIGDGFTISQGGWAISTGYGSAPNQRLAFSVASSAMGGVQQTYSSVSISDDTWTHIAVSVDFSSVTDSIKMYINGTEDTSLTDGISGSFVENTTYNSSIGGTWTGSAGRLFEGIIDQVRIFSSALNATQVTQLYNETACVYTCTTDTVDYPTTNVAYYKLDNSAEDETGTYDGTATNINYTFGRFGQAAVFNGSTSSILLPNTMFNTAGVLSVSVWLKTTETNGYGFVLANRYGTHTFFVELYPNGTLQAGNWQGGGLNISTTSTVNDGNWHHYVYVNNSGAISVYLDGVLENTGTQTFLNQSFTNGNQIGNYDINNSETFDGSIDQVRIFSSALTSTQVTELYEEYECEDTSTFNPVLYTGNGSTQYISNVGFEPDFVWIKNRSSSNQNVVLFDSVRGVQRELRSDSTAVEQNRNGTIYSLKSFDDNGFTVGDNTAGNYNVNGAVGGLYSGNAEFVAWCWKAGGLAVTNTDGTITSQVSANTAAGFSVVTYVGSVSQTGTVGHGLDIAPNVIIVKNRDNLYNWVCYFSELGASDFLVLNENYASSSSDSRPWNDTAPTSSVFTASNGNFIPVNQNGSDFVAYCFHSVAGYSKMGSYSGTGSAGNFVSTSVDGDAGFEPAFVMIKRSNGTADWFIYDNKRASNLYLSPNLSNAEGTDGGIVFNSNGFTINVTYSDHNTIGGEYIYMAFA